MRRGTKAPPPWCPPLLWQCWDLPWDPVIQTVYCWREAVDGESRKERLHFNCPRTVIHHSPDGWEWGYLGSGPADFALNILAQAIPVSVDGFQPVPFCRGRVSAKAWQLHQAYKREVIADLPSEGGVILGQDLRGWIAAHWADGTGRTVDLAAPAPEPDLEHGDDEIPW